MTNDARTGGPITPDRFVDIVLWTREMMDATARKRGTLSPTAMQSPRATGKFVRFGMIQDGIAPEWLTADDWERWIEW